MTSIIGDPTVGPPELDPREPVARLLVANLPEGLLSTITLALVAGLRAMARRRALVKRLSAVETVGSTLDEQKGSHHEPDRGPQSA